MCPTRPGPPARAYSSWKMTSSTSEAPRPPCSFGQPRPVHPAWPRRRSHARRPSTKACSSPGPPRPRRAAKSPRRPSASHARTSARKASSSAVKRRSIRWPDRAPPSTGRGACACRACRWDRAGSAGVKSMVFGQLERGEPLAAEREDVLGQRRGAAAPVAQLDDRLDLLAPVVVRHAEDGDVGDRGVGVDHGLDLGRVDVHAAGDDHVALAIAEEQEPVGVEVAGVADGEELVLQCDRSVLSLSLWYSKRCCPMLM